MGLSPDAVPMVPTDPGRAGPGPPGPRARRKSLRVALALAALLPLTLLALALSREPTRTDPPGRAVATPVTLEQLVAEGDARLAQRDYEGALEAYDRALALGATHTGVYYRVGVALSHLGRQEETAAAFLWVARTGEPRSREVELARQWLQAAGISVEGRGGAGDPAEPTPRPPRR
jgi:tetratricopeptide (TPR) repeat protein